jgi:hypothetical protein
MFILLCELFVVLKYGEMNCNFVYGVFYNVLWNVNSSYMGKNTLKVNDFCSKVAYS